MKLRNVWILFAAGALFATPASAQPEIQSHHTCYISMDPIEPSLEHDPIINPGRMVNCRIWILDDAPLVPLYIGNYFLSDAKPIMASECTARKEECIHTRGNPEPPPHAPADSAQ